jgi:outer membrane protein
MKKTLIALMIAGASSGAYADTILGIYAGAGNWMASYDGDAGSDSIDVEELNLDDTDNLYFYAALEHPVPLIPNIRLAHTNVQVEGMSTLTSTFTLDEETYSQGTDVFTELDMTHTDGTLYYEILDNWVTFDIGLTARAFDGFIYVEDQQSGRSERVELSEVVPLGYVKAQFDLPFSGWRVGAEGNAISYSGDSFSDLNAKIGYMSDGLALDFGLDVGYRRMNLTIDDNDMQADLTIAGPYVEASVHF